MTNSDDLFEIYDTGEGKIKLRAKAEIEAEHKRKKKYRGNGNSLYSSRKQNKTALKILYHYQRDKVFDEIYDVRDESSKEGIRIVVEVKKRQKRRKSFERTLSKTSLEDTYGVNMLAVKR